ncbi:MAG: hypothetical protein RLZZ387_3244 [Chloroflexota bacterium]|jgi:subtilisin family serine protease
MHTRTTLLLTLLIFVALSPLPPGTLAAAHPEPPPIILPDPLAGRSTTSGEAVSRPITIMLELTTPLPPTEAAPAVASRALAQIATSQSDLRQRLAALGVPILFQTRAAYSGVAVAARPDQLQALRNLPGVAAARVIPPKARAATTAAEVVGAARLWSAARRQLLGQGVRIGVIDSGIDYTHATFGGPGTSAAFLANTPQIVEPGSFPTAKVVGGLDLVGDAYDASGVEGTLTPSPDPDPLDCGGHGTQVASVAAGYGVDASGAPYRGGYGPDTPFAELRVSPGIAPESGLVALKVFGCRGTTAFLTEAIDYAIDPNGDGLTADRLVDVLTISLGSPFGGAGDPDAVAVDRAVQAGVVVVVAAGGSGVRTALPDGIGDVFYAISSPASAELAIAVGASQGTPDAADDTLAPFSPRGPQQGGALKPDIVAPGVNILTAAVGSGSGGITASGTSVAAPQVAGAAALLRQLHPGWAPAQVKSALTTSATPLLTTADAPYPPSLAGAGRLAVEPLSRLEVLAYPAEQPGDTGLAFGAPWLTAPAELQRDLTIENTGSVERSVRLEAVTTTSEPGVQVSVPATSLLVPPKSSIRVPVVLSVQPQLLDNTPDRATALTQGGFYRYYLAEHGGYVRVITSAGSRVRVGHVAGVGDIEVTVGPESLRSTLNRGAVSKYITVAPGAQEIRVRAAGAAPDAPPLLVQPVNLTDGQDVTLVVSGRPGALRLSQVTEAQAAPPAGAARVLLHNADPYGDGSALDFYVDGALVAAGVTPGGAEEAAVAGGQRGFRAVRAGEPLGQSGLAARSFTAEAGQQFVLSVGTTALWARAAAQSPARAPNVQVARVPFQVFPKAASQSAATAGAVLVPASASAAQVSLRNTGARRGPATPGALPQAALVSGFSLDPGGISGPNTALPPAQRAADLQYVGVSSNLPITQGQDPHNQVMFFGISSFQPWSTPNEVEFRIYIDTNRDSTADFVLVTMTLGSRLDSPPNDVFISRLYRFTDAGGVEPTGGISFWNTLSASSVPGVTTAGLDPAPFNTRVMFTAASVASLGLEPGQTTIRYYVTSRARDAGRFLRVVDRVPSAGYLEYDIGSDAVTPINRDVTLLGARPLFPDVDGGAVNIAINQTRLAERGSQQVLLLHHHNPPESQAEVVVIQSSAPQQLGTVPASPPLALPLVSGP